MCLTLSLRHNRGRGGLATHTGTAVTYMFSYTIEQGVRTGKSLTMAVLLWLALPCDSLRKGVSIGHK